MTCDIGDSKALAAVVEAIADKHGRLDVLVNNAGITKDGLLLRMEDEDWDSVIDTNLKSRSSRFGPVLPRMMMREQDRPDHQHQFGRGRDGHAGPGELPGE